MFFYPVPAQQTSFAATLRSFVQADDLPFPQLLSETVIQRMASEEHLHFASAEDCVYTPAVTLWAFLAQCLSPSKSCVSAVARVINLRLLQGLPPCSAGTGAYCKARAKLTEPFLSRLTMHVADQLDHLAPENWRWMNRSAFLIDGTTCTLPDTLANQSAYPQPPGPQPGVGFPLLRLVVLISLATAVLHGAALGPYQGKETGETSLFRTLLDRFVHGDVVVADRYYCSYWLVALLQQRGVDVVFRLHASRTYNFQRGQCLGRGDHVVRWERPARPEWMDPATYEQIPPSLTMRELGLRINNPSSRTRKIVVATTLLDPKAYRHQAVCGLYRKRWQIELDIRSIKQTLQMDTLRCKTPAMVRKEIWAHFLTYNLVRKVMAQASWQARTTPRRLSFAAAVHLLDVMRDSLLLAGEAEQGKVGQVLLEAIAWHRVGDRPDRWEPRKVKRRPKAYPRLKRRRQEEQQEWFEKRRA